MLAKNTIALESIFKENKLFKILLRSLKRSKSFEENLFNRILNYVERYLCASAKVGQDAVQIYLDFIEEYRKDMLAFSETDKYPLELDVERKAWDRFPYDVVLLFSCLLAEHRFRIMQLLSEKVVNTERALMIGCGPGLEIDLLKSKHTYFDAYDLSLNPYVVEQHKEVNFYEEYFHRNSAESRYQSIYLIELLEHLSGPYGLLEDCHGVLENGGRMYLTTATNIPQFDHLYNFPADHIEFETKVKQMGFNIESMDELIHRPYTIDVKAKNRFYVLNKEA